MGVKSVRVELGKALRAALPKTWAVFPDFANTDEPTKKTLMLNRTSISRDDAPQGMYLNTYTLFVIVPMNKDQDYLDDALDEVLAVLDEDLKTRWTDAKRGLFENAFPSYEITLLGYSERK